MGPYSPIDLIPCQTRVGIAAEIPVDSTSTKVCTRESVSHRHVTGDHSDTPASRLKDFVANQQVFHFVAEGSHFRHYGAGFINPTLGNVILQSAYPIKIRVKATASDFLDLVKDSLTVTEREENRSKCPNLDTHVAQEERQVGDTAEFEQNRADPLGSWGRLHFH